MTALNDQQKQLLFDYSLGLTPRHEATAAEKLLGHSEEAVELYQTFQDALSPLDTVELDPCPDQLTQRLFARLKDAAQEHPDARLLDELLAAERARVRTIKIPLWRNWSEILTAAAAVFLFISILFPSIGFMRQKYGESRCGTQLGGVYEGVRNYAADHNGLLPAVATKPGAPWYRVGYQGEENYSNTRQVWPLVKYEYAQPSLFLCPGRPEPHKITFVDFKIQTLNDFPSRNYMQYSAPIACPTAGDRDLSRKTVLLADRNPISESLPTDLSQSWRLQLEERQLRANSANHRNRGQNVLLHDGSVEFTRKRHTSISEDDIYSLQGMSTGTELCGCERPACDTDFFLAP